MDRYISAHFRAMREHLKRGFNYSDTEHCTMFVDGLKMNMVKIWNEHFFPQHTWLTYQNGSPMSIDVLLILEKLEEGLSRLEIELGIKFKRIHTNISDPHIKKTLGELVSGDSVLRNEINTFYARDWELYNETEGKWIVK